MIALHTLSTHDHTLYRKSISAEKRKQVVSETSTTGNWNWWNGYVFGLDKITFNPNTIAFSKFVPVLSKCVPVLHILAVCTWTFWIVCSYIPYNTNLFLNNVYYCRLCLCTSADHSADHSADRDNLPHCYICQLLHLMFFLYKWRPVITTTQNKQWISCMKSNYRNSVVFYGCFTQQ